MSTDTMRWLYKRSIGEIEQKKKKLLTNGHNPAHQNVALIVGVTGISGRALAETLSLPDTSGGPWKIYGLARRPQPEWLTALHVSYIQCDISNPEETHSKLLSPLKDITHVFYVSFAGSEHVALNTLMFQNILDSVLPNAPILKHIALQTGIKHYFGNFSATCQPHECPYHENLPRLKQENFYYKLEDLLQKSGSGRSNLTWSVHRPALIFGFSPCSAMKAVSTLCAYAAICKHEGKPLVYTGTEASWVGLSDCVDSGLLADHIIWAGTDPRAKNGAFNVSNGDVFRWKDLWGVLGEAFGVESVGYEDGREAVSLEDLMRDKDKVWDEIVVKNGLLGTKLRKIAAFWFVDIAFSCTGMLSSVNKNREFGFLGFRDTGKSFVRCVEKMRDYRLIP